MHIMQDLFGTPMNMVVSYYDSLWNKKYESATARFNHARKLASDDWNECSNISAGEFFPFYKEWKKNNPTKFVGASVDGDFDDMGRGSYAGAYHYEQKKKYGRL